MKAQHVEQVLALERYLDAHDQYLKQSKAQYKLYTTDTIEELDFQTNLVKQALSAPNQMWAAELAMGSGKSILSARIAHDRLRDGPTIFLCPSSAALGDSQGGIINKFLRTFSAYGRHTYALGQVNDLSKANDVSFVTPQSFVYSLKNDRHRTIDMLERASCFIVDEAHHFPADVDDELKVYGDIFEAASSHVKDGLTVALTGTWDRLDRKQIMGKSQPDARLTVQDSVDLGRCPEIYGIQVITDVRAKDATYHGELYDLHLTGDERLKYYEGIAECMAKVYKRYPAPLAAFARTRVDANAIADLFNQKTRLGATKGIAVMTGEVPIAQRKRWIHEINSGARAGYITCAVGEEAIDLPKLEVVHLIRRTRSTVRNMQAIGRALRVERGKRRALVIDYQTMLVGLQDRFLGLACDDLLDCTRSRIVRERCMNGGPLVCQSSYQHGVLDGITMGEERAVICIDRSSKTRNKATLLKLAKDGAPRPKVKDDPTLARAILNYTSPSCHSYDPKFAEELWALRPDWRGGRSDADSNKQQLLELAQKGQKRPTTGKLGRAAKRYLTASDNSFDEAFYAQIKAIRPDWVSKRSLDEFKKSLIKRARSQGQKPSGREWYRMRNFLRNDPAFKAAIETARPEWLEHPHVKTAQTKEQLRERAMQQGPVTRPFGRLGEAFARYCTRPSSSSRDEGLTAELKLLRPEWFESSAVARKRELVELARSNGDKPTARRTPNLYWSFWGYVTKGHKTYDADFVAEIFSIRPDWQLLERPEAAPYDKVERRSMKAWRERRRERTAAQAVKSKVTG